MMIMLGITALGVVLTLLSPVEFKRAHALHCQINVGSVVDNGDMKEENIEDDSKDE